MRSGIASDDRPKTSRLTSLAEEKIAVVDWTFERARDVGGVMYPSVTPGDASVAFQIVI